MLVALIACASCENDDKLHLEVNKSALSFTKDGADREVTITSNQKWEIVIEDDTWLTASVAEGTGNATVTFTADPYNDLVMRQNRITVVSATAPRVIDVIQDAAEPILEVDKKNLAYNYAGGTEVLQITSNTAWEVVIEQRDSWLETDVSDGMGDGEVILSIPTYYGKENRHATFVIECDGIRREIEVSQKFPVTAGVWILSEGSAFQPTADLAYYDAVNDQLKPKFYSAQNGETLGQIANYMGLYGSKLYVAVSGPPDASDSSVKVIDPENGKLIETIEMKSSHGEGDVTRQMAFHGGKVYVTSYFSGGKGEPGDPYLYYGGVVRIDTASLRIEAAVRVGDKPEGIACHDNRLFVCNNSSGNGKTLSVIDIASFKVVTTIPVPENPTYIQTAANGEIYLSTLEIYTGDHKGPSAFHRLDPKTYAVNTFAGARAGRFAITDRYIFTGEFSYTTYQDVANRIDRQTGEVKTIELDHPYFMLYAFDANPATGDIYMGGQGDDVIFMTGEGEKLKSFRVGTPFVNQFIPILE